MISETIFHLVLHKYLYFYKCTRRNKFLQRRFQLHLLNFGRQYTTIIFESIVKLFPGKPVLPHKYNTRVGNKATCPQHS